MQWTESVGGDYMTKSGEKTLIFQQFHIAEYQDELRVLFCAQKIDFWPRLAIGWVARDGLRLSLCLQRPV